MAKKIIAVVVAVILVIGISVGTTLLVDKNAVPASTTIENGLSAYELAVQYGYEGTVQEWLTSLEGKSAYQVALDSGYSGTESEWLASLEATADNTASIKDAEFNSKGELILTLSDDTVLNLGVAVGTNGADGKDGTNGKDGANGKDGVDGKDGTDGISITTANINADGQLIIGFSDGKTVNLDKVVGMNGKDGVSVTSSKINTNGELVLTYSNGQEANLGVVIGAKGDKGDAGADGKDGTAIISTVINNNGELVITYSNNTTENLGVVVGRDGADGKDGQNGTNGIDGKDGVSVTGAEITFDGELVLTYSNNQRSNLGKVIGADGKDGQNGADGKDGQDGINGVDGKDGVSVVKSEINAKGELVITYSNNQVDNLGVVVGANGQNGADGKDGQNGADGKDGVNGKDGVGIKNIEITDADELLITLTNDSTLNLGCIKGADGKDGSNGKDGADGKDGVSVTGASINAANELVLTFSNNTEKNLGVVVGANGENGKNGTDGKDGRGIKDTEVNALGELVITYTDDTTDNLGVIVSDNGGAGTSANAPRVQINSTTNEWEISTDGGKTWVSTGVKATGENGKDGVDGADGEDGTDGISITEAIINENNELVLTFSNNTQKNLGVVVGADGEDGKNGTDGANGQDGEDGKTPYIKNGNWWIGDTDTGVKAEGKDGANGQDGQNGQDGANGDTPYIKNGNWWIGESDTGVKAEGVDGTNGTNGSDGKDGIGVSGAEIDVNDHLIIKLSNNTSIDVGVVVGADGEDGANGTNGTDGKDGKDGVGIKNVTVSAEGILTVTLDNDTTITLGNIKGKDGVGIAKTEINAEGKLVITYTDNKVVTLDKVVGSDGIGIKSVELTDDYMLKLTFTDNGTQSLGPIRGEKGADGKDGVGIKEVSVGNDGYLYVTYTNSDEALKIAYIKGDKGDKGDDGTDGKTPYVKDGNWWIGETDTGIKAEGVDGAEGSNGKDGKDGVSVVNSYVDDNLHLWIVLSDGTKIDAGYVGVTTDSGSTTTKYTVVFKNYDGTVLKTEEVESGKSATAPSNPSRDGFEFTGWDTDFSNVTSNIVVTAKYTENSDPTIQVSNVTAQAGATIQVPVIIKNNPGIAGATITVTFDTALTLTTASSGEAFSSLQYSNPGKFVSPCNFTWDSESGETSEDGTILYLTFTVPSTASAGDVYEISCSYRNGDIFNDAWDDVTLSTINGGITVN